MTHPLPTDARWREGRRGWREVAAMMAARLPQTDLMDDVAATLFRRAVNDEGMGSVTAAAFRETVYACAALDGYDTPQPAHVEEARGYIPRRPAEAEAEAITRAGRLTRLEERLDDLTVLVVKHLVGGALG